MGHIKKKKKPTSHYLSVFGTLAIMGACFFLGFIIGLVTGSNL